MSAPVLLIAPPLTFELAYPLRLASLATALESRGHKPIGLDLRSAPGALDRYAAGPARPSPALIVVECSIRNFGSTASVLARVKERFRCPVVVTGSAAAIEPARFLAPPLCADAAVTGDPELVVPALLAADLDSEVAIAGCHRRTSTGKTSASPGRFLNADKLPAAHRGVFPIGATFAHPLRPAVRFAAIEASRGCSLACSFCPVPHWSGAQTRCRPVAAVVDEMQRIRGSHGATHFLLEDDQPLLDRRWWLSLLSTFRQQLAPTGARLELPNGLRPDLLDDEVLSEMAGCGVTRLALGIESGCERVRGSLNRPIDDAALHHVIDSARRRELVVTGYFMLGLPGESRRERRQTLRAARSLPLHYAHLCVYWPWRRLLTQATAQMNGLASVRAAGYLWAYCKPSRLMSLGRLGDLSGRGFGTAVRRMRRQLASGVVGGGGW